MSDIPAEIPIAPLFTKAKAAELAGISVRTLERMIAAQSLDVLRFSSRCVRIPKAELARLLAGEIKTPSGNGPLEA